ncbi:haloacid dehalogenase-like hydrolase [Filifactor villosus]|uniref:Haloacid dehalogenase-like hydrolase n=1 Tax=Filifactor villosus TaxID=29374 RepID=A0ABV9QKX0_9FIRM
MEVFVYDFDGTIYDGDSSVDFFMYVFKKNPGSILKIIPLLLYSFILYFCKRISKKTLKERYFSFLKHNTQVDDLLRGFWEENFCKLKPWYLEKRDHSRDIIISASPEFLLHIPAQKIGVFKLIATKVDKETGQFLSENCYGKEKVNRLYEFFPECNVLESYSDSYSDSCLFDISHKAYLVKKGEIILVNR